MVKTVDTLNQVCIINVSFNKNSNIQGYKIMKIVPKFWRKNSSLKTVNIVTHEWFDRVNGNTYFANEVTVNQGLKNEFSFNMPFEYGYGDHSLNRTAQVLKSIGATNLNVYRWSDCKDNNITVNQTRIENCKKRDLMAIKGDYL